MPAPERVGDRYRLDELLARGGMASVYRGHDEQLDRPVAVKLMRAEFGDDPNTLRRFESEALRAAAINDPHLVAVYDVGSQDGTPYIVMELIEGGDLAATIAREGHLDPERAARIGVDVAAALEAAHRAGVVHRDVKPGNILLDPDGRARVADFGIARATGDESLTRTGAILGSVDYFSPEQARGERATPSSDIYALGVVLYELVTGQRPFAGETPYAVATARLRQPPPDARYANPGVPQALAEIIRRAMSRAPADRFSSAGELRAALEAWIDGPRSERPATSIGPLVPSAASRPVPTRRERGARRAVPWLLGAGLLLLLLVSGYIWMRALGDPASDGVANPIDVIAGTPGGEAQAPTASPTATAEPTEEPSPEPTPEPTAEPTDPATPPPATSGPLAVAGTPDDAVAAFYARVVDGEFDAAYALWSDRMKATYPRQGNLDDRFAETASITFSQLFVASRSGDAATVQANFTERYDGGGSREFVGYWNLVRVDGAWLLDEPHY